MSVNSLCQDACWCPGVCVCQHGLCRCQSVSTCQFVSVKMPVGVWLSLCSHVCALFVDSRLWLILMLPKHQDFELSLSCTQWKFD